jgi:hypothetical protein
LWRIPRPTAGKQWPCLPQHDSNNEAGRGVTDGAMSRLPVRTTKVFRVIRTIYALTPICAGQDREHQQDRESGGEGVWRPHQRGLGPDGNLLSR